MFDVTANGASIPALGFGTFRIPGADVLRIVPHALKAGSAISIPPRSTAMRPRSGKLSLPPVWRAATCF